MGDSRLKEAAMFQIGFRESEFRVVLGKSWEDNYAVSDGRDRQGIGVNVHNISAYQSPYYEENGYGSVHCENAEQLYENMSSLSLYPLLKDEPQDIMIQAVKLIL